MEISKKINKRLTRTTSIIIPIFIIIIIILITYGSNKISSFTTASHYRQLTEDVQNYSSILKAVTQQVGADEEIIHFLDHFLTTESIDQKNFLALKNQIALYENILQPITFINTINIVSLPGQYLVSSGTLFEDFDVTKRPWFKEEYLDNYQDPIITSAHKDYTTGKYAISIIKFIYSNHTNTLSGVVILDIFIDDLLDSMDKSFYLGTLKSYLNTGNGMYLSRNGLYTLDEIPTQDTFIYSDTILDNKVDILFAFDKSSLIYSKYVKQVTHTTIVILLSIGCILLFTLTRLMSFIIAPLTNSLDHLKILLKNLEKNNFELELNDEFEQLEFISEALSKSFDKKVQSLIYYDELTGLPNRKMLFKLTTKLIKKEQSFALLFIDLNKFKYINDLFGHTAGDELLISFSRALEDVFADKGIVTRYSGDEFVIIYDRYTCKKDLLDFYNFTVIPTFTKPIYFNQHHAVVEFSAGAAIYPNDATTFDDLIRKSDFIMYHCKKNDPSKGLIFFNPMLYATNLKVEDIKMELKQALSKDEFLIHYQPIVGKDQSIHKIEALLRWRSEKYGFVAPSDFILYAEETGAIISIGYWIIEEICKNFNPLSQTDRPLQISINVSPIQLMDIHFTQTIKKIAEKYSMDFSNLCFEITESVVLDENMVVYDNLHALHNLGITIALDDFGTGYSSFNYLRKYQLDILKIDRIFIQDSSNKYLNIVKNINDIAHLLGMEVIIEGVETKEQFDVLNNMGCDYFQGYYFSHPVTLEELKHLTTKSIPH
ncbi:EAL domain-containing protein [Niameybacter massiliensis]|uniref:EAL domain-containing protein n=1 Tax=Holtiella tumoricola TaxID=3018743 RepID=A0AA42DNB6_9FIRM|nr:EAL domain-containing protein [Holtiella tumoricola]MDA3731991.1 EAL domain-containing protein [Holtiella tumoricola]